MPRGRVARGRGRGGSLLSMMSHPKEVLGEVEKVVVEAEVEVWTAGHRVRCRWEVTTR